LYIIQVSEGKNRGMVKEVVKEAVKGAV